MIPVPLIRLHVCAASFAVCCEVEADMSPRHVKIDYLFFVVIVSAIIGLIVGSEIVRWLMAGTLAMVAVPLWVLMRREHVSKGIARAAEFIRDRPESS